LAEGKTAKTMTIITFNWNDSDDDAKDIHYYDDEYNE